MAFAAFSLISPLIPSTREASVTPKQLPTNETRANGTYGGDIIGSNGADRNDLVNTISQLREEVKTLEKRHQALLDELEHIKRDQMDEYVYARMHLTYTSKLCQQVERIIKRKESDVPSLRVKQVIKPEDSDAESLKVLRKIDSDISEALKRYYAPGSNDPLRFLKQRALRIANNKAKQTKSAGDSPVPSPTAEGDQWRSIQIFCTIIC